jgi:hypothetical protein
MVNSNFCPNILLAILQILLALDKEIHFKVHDFWIQYLLGCR